MAEPVPWFERVFTFDAPQGIFPNVIERLRGTPSRLEERLRPLPRLVLTRKTAGTWSIQENAGHLFDLEPLWAGRVDDFIAGSELLRAADLTNRKTHQAGHNDSSVEKILSGFRTARMELVRRLDGLDPASFTRTALHPG